jgi:positive regulator of sigma E activity
MLGRVVEIVNDSQVKVEISCEKEENSDGNLHCGACGFLKKDEEKKIILANKKDNLFVGTMVNCELEENAQIKSSALLLLLPLLIFLISSGVVSSLTMKIGYILLISFSALVITFLFLKYSLKEKTYYYACALKGK